MSPEQWEAIREQVAAGEASALKRLDEFVRIPSVAHPTHPTPALMECAERLVAWLQELGAENARVASDYLHPLVIGEIVADPSRPTILVYGHFDVQDPGPPEAWLTPPFACTVRDGRIFGRGTGDSKGQLLGHLLAIEAYRARGIGLPVNLRFIFDGSEEIGSASLAAFAATRPSELRADLLFASDGPVHESGRPTLVLGARGIAYLRIRLRTLRRSAHSQYAPVLPSAAWRAVELLSSLRDESGRIAIDGFYDRVLPLTPEDRDLLGKIPSVVAELEDEFAPNPPLPSWSAAAYYRRLLLEPVLNIAGLAAGDLSGNQTTLPHEALIKLEVGLVPEQRSCEILEMVRRHVAKFGVDPADVELVFAVEPSRTPPSHPLVRPLVRALERVWAQEPVVMHRFSAYAPFSIFEQLGMTGFYIPYAQPDESNHAPNENLAVEYFLNGILTSAAVFDEIGAVQLGVM